MVNQDGHLRFELTPISKASVRLHYGREVPDYGALGLDPNRVCRIYRDADNLAKAAPNFLGKPSHAQAASLPAMREAPHSKLSFCEIEDLISGR
ncbi:DUF2213 domain-containing protein [Bradyrhizobium sp. Arg314]